MTTDYTPFIYDNSQLIIMFFMGRQTRSKGFIRINESSLSENAPPSTYCAYIAIMYT